MLNEPPRLETIMPPENVTNLPDQPGDASSGTLPTSLNPAIAAHRRLRGFAVFASVLTVCFAKPLFDLVQFCLKHDLYSHILLIPFVSAYLMWQARTELPATYERSAALAFITALSGFAVLAGYFALIGSGAILPKNDYLAMMTFAFLAFLAAGAFFLLGANVLRTFAFPAGFLLFMVPFPTAVENWIEIFFQYASADAAYLLMTLANIPVLREGLIFKLPGITIQVAQECSGIRSTLVLFITSLVAGHMFLRTLWKQAVLTFAVIPLAILRNGFRITTISWLCVNVDPGMINSPIHHHGGPIFFALSLIPFFG